MTRIKLAIATVLLAASAIGGVYVTAGAAEARGDTTWGCPGC